jgi:hypothetical protein
MWMKQQVAGTYLLLSWTFSFLSSFVELNRMRSQQQLFYRVVLRNKSFTSDCFLRQQVVSVLTTSIRFNLHQFVRRSQDSSCEEHVAPVWVEEISDTSSESDYEHETNLESSVGPYRNSPRRHSAPITSMQENSIRIYGKFFRSLIQAHSSFCRRTSEPTLSMLFCFVVGTAPPLTQLL